MAAQRAKWAAKWKRKSETRARARILVGCERNEISGRCFGQSASGTRTDSFRC